MSSQKEQTVLLSTGIYEDTIRIFSMMFLFSSTESLKVNISSPTKNESKLVLVVQKIFVCLFLTW